ATGRALAASIASCAAATVAPKICSGSCSTQPGRGKYWATSRYPRDATAPSSRTIRHVTPVVPASIASTCRMSKVVRRTVDVPDGDDGRYQRMRRDVERRIVDADVAGRDGAAIGETDLVGVALLDTNVGTRGGDRVDRRHWRGDVERDAVVARRD